MIWDKIFKNSEGGYVNIIDVIFGNKDFNNYIYTIAEAHAIDLIAKTIAKCEIQTFQQKDNKILKEKGYLYWLLNIQPNSNDTGTNFIYKLVTKLLVDKKALAIINGKNNNRYLYVADSYDSSNQILNEKIFKNVTIVDNEGNSIVLNKTYLFNEVLYLSLDTSMLQTASENFKVNIQKILKVAQKNYISSNNSKWRLKNPGGQPKLHDAETGEEISYNDYKKKITDGLFSDEDAILLLSEIFDLINLNKDMKSVGIDDLEKIINRIGNTVANKWNIPLDVFWGNKTEKSTGSNDFITYAVDPYFEVIEDALNISFVGKKSYLNGEYIKFNRLNIGYKDLIDKSSGWDKLISNGFSFNQLCELLGLPTINEEWANQHYITKNYANVKGGAEDEE